MSKLDLLTIAIVIVCLAALGYLVYKIVNLMNPPEAVSTSIQDSYNDKATDEDTYTDWDDEVDTAGDDVDLDDDDAGSNIADDAENTSTEAGNFDENELDEESTGLAESETITSSAGSGSGNSSDSGNAATSYENTSSSSSSNGGKYMVLAGTYRLRANADNQAARLRNLGYQNTEVKLFDKGSYAVVLVDRFSSLSKARRLIDDLATDEVDAVVSTKN